MHIIRLTARHGLCDPVPRGKSEVLEFLLFLTNSLPVADEFAIVLAEVVQKRIFFIMNFPCADLRVFLAEEEYRIPESGGPLMICLELNYATDQDFTADVNIRENSPIDAIGT